MKILKWVIACAVVLLLAGCSMDLSQNGEEWTVKENIIEAIQNTADCTERKARGMLDVFRDAQMPEPVSITTGENGVLGETGAGGRYEGRITKKHDFYFIKNLTTGEMVYMVQE